MKNYIDIFKKIYIINKKFTKTDWNLKIKKNIKKIIKSQNNKNK